MPISLDLSPHLFHPLLRLIWDDHGRGQRLDAFRPTPDRTRQYVETCTQTTPGNTGQERESRARVLFFPVLVSTATRVLCLLIRSIPIDNFKPESVDTSRPGTVETKRSKDEAGPSSVTVVRPSQQVRCRAINQTTIKKLNVALLTE